MVTAGEVADVCGGDEGGGGPGDYGEDGAGGGGEGDLDVGPGGVEGEVGPEGVGGVGGKVREVTIDGFSYPRGEVEGVGGGPEGAGGDFGDFGGVGGEGYVGEGRVVDREALGEVEGAEIGVCEGLSTLLEMKG